jgi:S-adenosylmethionine-diacylglycerol 3-amino-3-carboxypropyl transferase
MRRSYFNNLNYSLGNEDTRLEYSVLPKNSKHIFVVAGSGSRVLPLFAKFPQKVTCADTSAPQLYVTELRIESMRVFTHEEYLSFWGYPETFISAKKRKKLFKKIQLSENAHLFITSIFKTNNWESILYIGAWEKTLNTLSKIIRIIMGDYTNKLFSFTNQENYNKFIQKNFPKNRLFFLTLLFGNAFIFNTLLYKGSFPKKNIPETMQDFYYNSFYKLLHQDLPRNNFLLQIIFFGKLLYSEGNPLECEKKVYLNAQKGIINAQIKFVLGDFISTLSKNKSLVDFVSLSDISSYFSADIECNYLQNIRNNISSGCKIVERQYIHIPRNVDTSGYTNTTHMYKKEIEQEKTQMYNIKIWQKK